jgi:uncharacterized membrane protein YeiH
VILGVITAIGGGLLRDVLAGRKTLIMSHELYAIPVTLGCCVYVLILNFLPQYVVEGSVICMLGIFGLRAAAIYWDLRVPKIFITKTIAIDSLKFDSLFKLWTEKARFYQPLCDSAIY